MLPCNGLSTNSACTVPCYHGIVMVTLPNNRTAVHKMAAVSMAASITCCHGIQQKIAAVTLVKLVKCVYVCRMFKIGSGRRFIIHVVCYNIIILDLNGLRDTCANSRAFVVHLLAAMFALVMC